MSNSSTFQDLAKQSADEEALRDARAGARTLMLSVDTATETRSVAIVRGGELLSLRAQDLRESGASSILRDVDEALRAAGVGLREVELLAVCRGPGSFTGLRSGLATLKALSVTLHKPVVGLHTLHAIAFQARPSRRLFALLPAGRGEVFAQLLCVSEDGRVSELGEAMHVAPSRLLEHALSLGGSLSWAGSGASKYLSQIEEAARASGLSFTQNVSGRVEPSEGAWQFVPTTNILAPGLAALALSSFNAGASTSAEHLSAIYVRPSDAELNERCHEQG
jgi:tRNA threonylcarbamoyladenosine biosynthesis protein TsaB